jgi:hypothetical protein
LHDLKAEKGTYAVNSWDRPQKVDFRNWNPIFQGLYGAIPYDGANSFGGVILMDLQHTIRDEDIDGHRVKCITSQSAYGTHRLWVDPEAGYAPRRFECQKKNYDLYGNTPISMLKPITDLGDRRPHQRPVEFRFIVDQVQLSPIASSATPIVSRFQFSEIRLYEGGATFIRRTSVKLSNIRLECTDADLTLTLAVPDATPVTIQDAPSIRAIWQDGEVVKSIDRDALLRFDGVELKARSTRRWTLIAMNTVAILILLWLLVRRWHAAKAS